MLRGVRNVALGIAALSLLLVACSDDSNSSTDSAGAGAGSTTGPSTGGSGGMGAAGGAGATGGAGGAGGVPTIFGGDRPVELQIPDSYDAGVPTPLVILLHGYTASGAIQNGYFGMSAEANQRGVLFAFPDGTIDAMDNRFWNATDACCNFYGSDVDDSAYLRGLVDDISAAYNVDPKRVHFVGHSNGGFMSYRMACDHADIVASIASLAGAMYDDTSMCGNSEPVHALQIHGDLDDTIEYPGGGVAGFIYPSAVASTEYWAGEAGCDLMADTTPAPLDLDEGLMGDETTVARYATNCDAGGSGELWTIVGGGHVPALTDGFSPAVMDFLLSHPKP